jgi:hypothetical protein
VTATFPFLLVVAFLPTPGYIVDCSSWPGGMKLKLTIHLELTDGTKFETGRIEYGPTADSPLGGIYSAIEDSEWNVTIGPKETVLVFGPPGVGVKSIKFDSTGWTPKLKRVFGPAPPAKR